jgi:3-hydroxyisobutyrate dehydrogenase-like beta-hydroxyacid dehydrogenase
MASNLGFDGLLPYCKRVACRLPIFSGIRSAVIRRGNFNPGLVRTDMNGSNDNTAPRICILGYGRLAEALAEKLGQASSGINVFTRRPPRAGANNVHFFGDVRQAIDGASFVLAVTSDFTSIIDILRDIDDLDGKTFIQISTLSPSQSLTVEKEVKARRGRYVENPVLGSRPEARSGTLIAMAGPAANIDDDVSAFLGIYSNRRIIFDAVGQASALKLIFNFLIGALTASFSVALNAARKTGSMSISSWVSYAKARSTRRPSTRSSNR